MKKKGPLFQLRLQTEAICEEADRGGSSSQRIVAAAFPHHGELATLPELPALEPDEDIAGEVTLPEDGSEKDAAE